MNILRLPLIFLVICAISSTTFAQRLNVTEVLDNLFQGYDHRIRPQFAGRPIEVNVTMYILGISSVSEKNMDFTMDLYFRQFWTDERLKFQQRPGFDRIILDSSNGLKLWEPDTFFPSEKMAFVHVVMNPNYFIRIHSDGKISKSSRISITASCPMDLRYFPMDSQICSLEMESYVYKATDIVYSWGALSKSVGISPEVELPEFNVIGHRTRNMLLTLSTGTYSRLGLDILFKRAFGYYVLQVYVPVAMLVIISWTAFLFRNALIRMLIALSTTLTMTMLLGTTNAALPRISYTKALDVYCGISLMMVFATLIVHVVVEYLATSQSGGSQNDQNGDLLIGKSDKNALDLGVDAEGQKFARLRQIPPRKLDRFAIIGFPIFFLLFNFLYCVVYSSLSGIDVEGLTGVGNIYKEAYTAVVSLLGRLPALHADSSAT